MHRITIQYGAPEDPAGFESHYADHHVPLVAALPGIERFTTALPRGLTRDAPYMVAELWFASVGDLRTALSSEQMTAAAADAAAFKVASTTIFTSSTDERAI